MILRDPVHGLISFEGEAEQVVVRLMDTREVQRLRRIRALGPAALAFPGAEHSRFAHAVGSAHVMKRYLDRVERLSSDIPAADRIDAAAARIALAAALLHDIGHGPYSHTFESLFPGARHEVWTSRIVLDPDTEVHRVLRSYDRDMPAAVDRLIRGEHDIRHLARAVSGTFDVDRCDYLMRDAHMTGVRYGLLDLDWLLRSLRLYVPAGSVVARLAVDGDKGLTAVEGFFLARLYMYRQVYLHKAVRAAETLIRAVFRRLADTEPVSGIPSSLAAIVGGNDLSVADYLALDDPALYRALELFEQSKDAILSDLAGRIRHRHLLKSLAIRLDVESGKARARLDAVLDRSGFDPAYYGIVDRVEVEAYEEDEALMALQGGRVLGLLDASHVLRGLAHEPFVHYRILFPPEVREAVSSNFADLR